MSMDEAGNSGKAPENFETGGTPDVKPEVKKWCGFEYTGDSVPPNSYFARQTLAIDEARRAKEEDIRNGTYKRYKYVYIGADGTVKGIFLGTAMTQDGVSSLQFGGSVVLHHVYLDALIIASVHLAPGESLSAKPLDDPTIPGNSASEEKPKLELSTDRNASVLNEFISYCRTHPHERFWQALRNWTVFDSVWVQRGLTMTDTFYWEDRNGFKSQTKF